MIRKGLMGQYRLYYKNLQSFKKLLILETKSTGQQYFLPTYKPTNQKQVCAQTVNIINTIKASICSNNLLKSTEESRKQECCNKQNLNSYLKLKVNKSRFLKKIYQNGNGFFYGTAGLSVTSHDVVNSNKPNVDVAQHVIEPIPEPPPVLDIVAEAANTLNALGEPTLTSLGLGGWSPIGVIQNSLEFLHVTLNVPWWGAIAIGTLVVRLLLFPLVVITQRNAARMNNYLPQLQMLQVKMTEARQSGNQMEAARYSQELMLFMKEKNLNPLKNMIVPLAQMPVFVSFFVGLRRMSNLPVESLTTGGMFWFADLTVPDQFYILPIITSATLWITVELGTDTGKLTAHNMQTMKYFLRALPIIIFPFTINFPGVILCYWVSSNFISLAQVGFLKIPKVRDYFKIEPLITHNPENLPIQSKGFAEGLKESWTNAKIARQLEERRRFDEMQFKRAGSGPVQKTYKYDPTQQTNRNPISAKKR